MKENEDNGEYEAINKVNNIQNEAIKQNDPNNINQGYGKVTHANIPITQNNQQQEIYHKDNLSKIEEKTIQLNDGCKMLLLLLSLIIVSVILIVVFSVVGGKCLYVLPVPCLTIVVTLCFVGGFITIPPNNAVVITYYGKYIGTCKENGYFWVKPCTEKNTVSLKSNQFNGHMIKVNEKSGNPVLIGCIAVWKIRDTAKVIFGVNNYQGFVGTQVESAVRYVSCRYPYESANPEEPSLKSASEEINQLLKLELERRIKIAGIEIEDARITEISYGQEIATVMLKKQAADVSVAAKEKIATGSVQIIEKSMKEIENRQICDFKPDEKTKLVSNMMIVLNMDGHSGSTLIKI